MPKNPKRNIYRHKNSPYWQYTFEINGERFSGSTRETSERKASAFVRARRAEVETELAIEAGASRGPTNRRDIPFGVAAQRYFDERGRHTKTSEEIDMNLERLVRWIGEDRPLTKLDDALLSEIVARRRKDFRWNNPKHGHISPRQVNYSVTLLLKRILLRARDVWKIPLPDMPDWKQHTLPETTHVREVTHAEEAMLAAVEREDYRPARLFAQVTGLRRREVVNMTWPMFHWAEGYIEVIGKGNKFHRIPITDEIRAIVEPLNGHDPEHVFTYVCKRSRWCSKSKRDFVKGERYPITYWGWGTAFKRDVSKAKLNGDITIHKLRHTAGSRMARATGDLGAAQRLLNHSSVATTRKYYADSNLDDLAEAMRARATDDAQRRGALEKTAAFENNRTHEAGEKSRKIPVKRATSGKT